MAKKPVANDNLQILKQSIKTKELDRLYIFHGEEVFLLNHYFGQMKKILLDDLKVRIGEKLKSMKGETVEVLLEGVSARNAARWSGRTSGSFVVHFEPDEKCVQGTLRHVKITQVNTVSLFGTLLPE